VNTKAQAIVNAYGLRREGEGSPSCMHRGKTRLDLPAGLAEPGVRDETCA